MSKFGRGYFQESIDRRKKILVQCPAAAYINGLMYDLSRQVVT